MGRKEGFFKRIFMSAPIGIYIVQDGKFQFINPQFLRITGYREDELLGLEPMGLVLSEYRDYVRQNAIRMLKGERFFPYEYCVLRKDGEKRWILETVTSLNYSRKRTTLGYFMDITEHKKLEEALRRSEDQYRTAIEHSSDGVAIILKGNYLFVNRKFVEIFGYESKDEIIGKPEYFVVHPDDLPRLSDVQAKGEQEKEVPSVYEFKGIRKDGKSIDVEVSRTHTTYRGEEVSLVYLRDVSERKRMEEALLESERRYRELSIRDSLTDLFNLRYFNEQIKIEIERSRRYSHPLSLLLLDIDDFKIFNDRYGHLEGDKVLVKLGEVLRRVIRKVDSAYRYGGEEFMVILPETDGERAVVAAERIRKEFQKEQFFPSPGVEVNRTLSIGVAEYRLDEGVTEFIHRADTAMYLAKRNGKNQAFLLK